MDGIMFALLITFTICFIIGFGGCYFKTQNQSILEETERLIRRTNNDYMDSYYKSSLLRMDEIEKTFLTETACLATKNNNDIKEIKEKITTGGKNKRISQLVDENNKLKKKNKKLKEKNKKLKEKNNTCFYVYNPYTGVVSLREYDVIKVNNFKW